MSVTLPQTSFSAAPAQAIAGMLADAGRVDCISRVAKTDLGFGLAVMQYVANDNQCDKLGASTDVILGVTVYDASLPPAGSYNGASYAGAYVAGMAVRIARKGRIWVLIEQDVDPTLAVYARYTASGGNTVLGKFRVDADSSKAQQITQAKWLTTTTAASGLPALLEVNIP